MKKYFFVLKKGKEGKPVIDENKIYSVYKNVEAAFANCDEEKGWVVFSYGTDENLDQLETMEASELSKIKLEKVSRDVLSDDIQEQSSDRGTEAHDASPARQPKQVGLMEGNSNVVQGYSFVLDVSRKGGWSPKNLEDGQFFTGYRFSDEAIVEKKRVEPKDSRLPIQKAIFAGAFLRREDNQFLGTELLQAYEDGDLIRDWNVSATVKTYLNEKKALDDVTILSYKKKQEVNVVEDEFYVVANANDQVPSLLRDKEDVEDVEDVVIATDKKFADVKDEGIIRAIHLLQLLDEQKNNSQAMQFIMFAILAYKYGRSTELRQSVFEAFKEDENFESFELTAENIYAYFYPVNDAKSATDKVALQAVSDGVNTAKQQLQKRYMKLAAEFHAAIVRHDFNFANFVPEIGLLVVDGESIEVVKNTISQKVLPEPLVQPLMQVEEPGMPLPLPTFDPKEIIEKYLQEEKAYSADKIDAVLAAFEKHKAKVQPEERSQMIAEPNQDEELPSDANQLGIVEEISLPSDEGAIRAFNALRLLAHAEGDETKQALINFFLLTHAYKTLSWLPNFFGTVVTGELRSCLFESYKKANGMEGGFAFSELPNHFYTSETKLEPVIDVYKTEDAAKAAIEAVRDEIGKALEDISFDPVAFDEKLKQVQNGTYGQTRVVVDVFEGSSIEYHQ